ncbi:hypothetical protein AXG93_2752s1850 [Marchantia polymorpha subsp. ruderalis]|uniref:Uncharacterized protein n=1 Tax=Marchantia polymorpha subsp. ruderalis TaxID=1480154 RepID=A0A176VTP8_MARPO|nr:hypothetical protein AXG93_2752s1850 [Marchantia polymorpha subsp. ruderalis]
MASRQDVGSEGEEVVGEGLGRRAGRFENLDRRVGSLKFSDPAVVTPPAAAATAAAAGGDHRRCHRLFGWWSRMRA